jgi:DNA-binding XRE family transcriptional regulator
VAEPSFWPSAEWRGVEGSGVEGSGVEPIQVAPVVVLSQIFPARPSSIPDIRDFVRRCLAESPLTEEGTREVGQTVFRALLDAAGPTGSIHVAFRIFPEHVEVDVLRSDSPLVPPVQKSGPAVHGVSVADQAQADVGARVAALTPTGPVSLGGPGQPTTFAEWMSSALRSQNMTQEAAARQLGVSVKTISRWVGGATEPRMKELRRIQEVFGSLPVDVGG